MQQPGEVVYFGPRLIESSSWLRIRDIRGYCGTCILGNSVEAPCNLQPRRLCLRHWSPGPSQEQNESCGALLITVNLHVMLRRWLLIVKKECSSAKSGLWTSVQQGPRGAPRADSPGKGADGNSTLLCSVETEDSLSASASRHACW